MWIPFLAVLGLSFWVFHPITADAFIGSADTFVFRSIRTFKEHISQRPSSQNQGILMMIVTICRARIYPCCNSMLIALSKKKKKSEGILHGRFSVLRQWASTLCPLHYSIVSETGMMSILSVTEAIGYTTPNGRLNSKRKLKKKKINAGYNYCTMNEWISR